MEQTPIKKIKIENQCSFCSCTNEVFFKGLLSALICEDCLRSLLLMCFEKMVDSFEIKK
jgi:hypothetical protein